MTTSYAELFFTNIFVVLAVWFFEFIQGRKRRLESKIILYEKIDLIKVGREEELKADLVERTGLDIVNVEVGHINFLKDTAYIKVYYRTTSQNINTINHLTKVKSDNYFNA